MNHPSITEARIRCLGFAPPDLSTSFFFRINRLSLWALCCTTTLPITMHYLTLLIASAFVFASQASAQMPDLPECLMGCFKEASSTAGCSSEMDMQCMCTNEKFTKPAMTCVLTKCTAEEQDTASKMYTQYCVAFAGNSTTPANTSASSTPSSAPAASPSKSAGHNTGANLGLLLAGAGVTLFAL
ncbi:unnamed protein product [Rhizoctonia solani]|uniref:CFEM domain-containing protein n=1 Tax=Rhizoctonia solani TaxID=456999 RepID=A0A8H3DZP3_9AGAM|nr:unnamed protein product [Rhizoctonia solani]